MTLKIYINAQIKKNLATVLRTWYEACQPENPLVAEFVRKMRALGIFRPKVVTKRPKFILPSWVECDEQSMVFTLSDDDFDDDLQH